MKNWYLSLLSLIIANTQAQYVAKYEAKKVIVENVGQFDSRAYMPADKKVAYAFDGFSEDYFFTKNGVTISFEKILNKKEEDEKERTKERVREFYKHGKLITPEEHAAHELKEKKLDIKRDLLHTEWIGANPNATLEVSDKTALKSGYTFYDKSGKEAHHQLATYKTLTYKNLYPNIDIKYEMQADKGYKYSLIVRPGADLSKVKLRYSKNAKLTQKGTIETPSMYGKIIDHAPYSFYEGSKTPIETKYQLQNNEISFAVANYDKTKTLVIDPWTQTPAFNTQWDCVWECEKDAAGNAYLIGGVMPMQLIKYNSAGVQQWVHNTPYDTTSWLGTFAVDNAGNSFVTLGTTVRIQRVSTAGVVAWSNTNPSGLNGISGEFWSISFNCDQTKLIIGGTGGSIPPLPFIYDVNMNTGNATANVQVTGGALFPTQEVRALTACGNGKYYFLTHDSIGYIHQSLTSCLPPNTRPFHVSSGFSLGYKCENWRVNNTGIEAIAYSGGFIYTHKGNEVQKRDFATAAVVGTVAIPGGQFSGGAVRCSGLDVDDCGNVYAGSTTGVVKFNANLVQQATYATTFNVYDVAVSTSGDIICCGSNGTSSSGARQGYMQSFAASACAPIAIVCCDATMCPVPPKCTSDGPVTLVATSTGGTFSGPGVTGNTFNPATAGVGVHTIRHTIACGVDSIQITVNNCTPINVCKETNGQFTVSGGNAPFTWSVWDSIGRTCSGIVFLGNCTGTWTTNYGWRQVAVGATVTIPANKDSIQVVDNAGTTFTSYNKNLIPLCNPCNLTLPSTKSLTQCQSNTGTITVTPNGGTPPYTYTWADNGTINSGSRTGLGPGFYRVTVTAGAGCTKDTMIELVAPNSPQIQNDSVWNETCLGSNNGGIRISAVASAFYSLNIAPLSNPSNITNNGTNNFFLNLAPGTYIIGVLDNNGCTDTIVRTVGPGINCCNLAIQSKTITQPSCGLNNGSINVTMTGGTLPYTYTWTPNVSTTNTANNLGAGSYRVVIAAGVGCTKDTTFSLTGTTAPNINTVTSTNELCQGQNNGSVTAVNTTGGSPTYTYGYSPSSNPLSVTPIAAFPLNNLAPGTYIMGVQDANTCRDTFWFTIAAGPICCNLAIQSKTITQPSCGLNNGSINVTMTGGTLPYTYTWTPNVSTTNTASNLGAGSYRVVIAAGVGCTKDTTFSLTGTTAPNINTVTSTNELCQGQNNGSVTAVNTTGGSPTYTYGYSPSSNPLSVTPIAAFPLNNLAPGTYIMGVQDANTCRDTFWFTIAAGPNCCNVALQSTTLTQPTCGQANGAISLNVTGGTTPYTYTWTPNVSTTNSASNLAAGPYRIVIGAGTNCSIDTTINLNSNSTLVLTLSNPVNPSCTANNGQITAALSGGTAPYTVTIDTGGTPQTLTVPFAITQTISNLPAGTINITVLDALNCTVTRSVTLTRPASPTINSIAKTNEQCAGANDGVLTSANTIGGNGSYTYTYAPQSNPSSTNAISSFPVNGLADDTYILSVQDGNGCTDTAWFTIVAGPVCCNLNMSAVLTNPACAQLNGAINVTTLLGSGNYTYAWSPGQVTEDISGIGVGNYTITITDVTQGCSKDSTFNLSNINGPVIDSVQKSDETCAGRNNGSIRLFATGGVGALTYTWSPALTNNANQTTLTPNTYSYTVSDANSCQATGTQTVQAGITVTVTNVVTNPDCSGNNGQIQVTATPAGSYQFRLNSTTSNSTGLFQNLSAGSYIVTVTSANGCTATTSATLTSPTSFTATISSQNISCNGANDGSATVNVVGGTAPITVTWSNTLQTSTITALAANTYTVTVTDGANCSAVLSTTVSEPSPLSVFLGNDTSFCGTSLVLDAQNAGLNFLWSTGETSQTITVLNTNTYGVTVSNGSGCSVSANINVSIYPQVSIELRKDTTIFDGGEVILTSTITGGSGSGNYSWTPTKDLNCADCPLPTSTPRDTISYFVTYTDDAGCIANDLINIYVDNDFSLYAPNAFSPNGDNKNNIYQVFGRGIKSLVLKIYNRWGEKLFESTDQKIGWDGTYKGSSQPVGVYVYDIEATYFSGKKKREKGSLTLIK